MSDWNDHEFALVGRFVVAVAASESVIGKLIWHLTFSQTGEQLNPGELHRKDMKSKLRILRNLVQQDGFRLDQQVDLLAAAYGHIEADRNALVHGFAAASVDGPVSLNLSKDYHVWAADLPQLVLWSRHMQVVAAQAYVDAMVGTYDAIQDAPPQMPIPTPPSPIIRRASLFSRPGDTGKDS